MHPAHADGPGAPSTSGTSRERDPDRLRPRLREAILSPRTAVLVSAATAWEIAVDRSLGRSTFPLERCDAVSEETGFGQLAMTAAHAIEAGSLPRHHAGPFDRMLVAQARTDDPGLASEDPLVAAYEARLFRANGAR